MEVQKRNGEYVEFDKEKIYNAIMKAMVKGSGIVDKDVAKGISEEIETECAAGGQNPSVSDIEKLVFYKLINKGQSLTAKAYEGYRSIREFQRNARNTTDEEIFEMISGDSEYWNTENSNKNAKLVTTVRDYMAGIQSTDLTRRYLLPPDVVQAHDDGVIHVHDMDYFCMHVHNCFHGLTRFVTSEGVVSFNKCRDGQIVEVLDKDGNWQKAVVRNYGKMQMQKVTLTAGRSEKNIVCTPDHRWILSDGTVTTSLSKGDRLTLLPEISTFDNEIDPKYFCMGMVLGDGCDTKTGLQIRLCGEKIKYKYLFEEQGYCGASVKDSTDYVMTKNGGCSFKKDFIDNHSWRYLSRDALRSLFLGYYAADGAKNSNRICTSNENLACFIRDVAPVAGYHVASETIETGDTNYKENRVLYCFRFRKHQPVNIPWIVKNIEPYHSTQEYSAWCVEEPNTKSFTLEGGIVTGNCDLVNLEDMLQNGTVISNTKIDKPHSFSTACNIATQIVAQVASSQYGGQTISLASLASFVDVSRQKIRKQVEEQWKDLCDYMVNDKEDYERFEDFKETFIADAVDVRLKEEISRGVQTIQYQLLTLLTTNGQTPFLSVNMDLSEAKNDQEKKDLAMVIEEVLRQRIQGIKNEVGAWVTPAFPKLLYVLTEENTYEDSEYFYLTKLAAECVAKRMVPDFISSKKMKELKINKDGNGDIYPCMGCRSFLTPWRCPSDPSGALNSSEPKYYGRFNGGVVTINLPDIALSSGGDFDKFWELFEVRTELCHKALQARIQRLKGTPSDVAPILWQHGALARLKKGETIDKLIYDGYMTISLGYCGLFECVKYMTGHSHTDGGEGYEFGIQVMEALNAKAKQWKAAESIDYSVYGTPIESTTYKFAKCLRKRFGVIEGITDKDYVTNSYHIFVGEPINAFDKLAIESKFQALSPGGAISYVEIPNLSDNLEIIIQIIQFIYENIMYAEMNTKSDYCMVCGYDKEIKIITDENTGKLIWECPQCGNRDQSKMSVCRRVCGYLSSNFFNQGRTDEIKHRVLHIDDMALEEE